MPPGRHVVGALHPAARDPAPKVAPSFSGPLHQPRTDIPVGTDEMLFVRHLLSHGASWRTFDFLGFHNRMRESWKYRGRWYLQQWPCPRAIASIRGKIRERTDRRFACLPLDDVVADLNPVLRGWGEYFRYGNSAAKFSLIDCYVNERLAILASVKHGLTGRNWVTCFNYEWVNSLRVHRLRGTVRSTTAYASR